MTVKPNNDSFAAHAWEDITVLVEGRGMLHIPDADGARGMTPKWRGVKTKKGELWKSPLPHKEKFATAVGDFTYVIGCPAGSAEIKIASDSTAGESDLLNWLDVIEVAWR